MGGVTQAVLYFCYFYANNASFCSFQRGFVEAHSDDGLVEIFGLKEGWHASFVMAELIKAKHIAQVLAFFYCPIFALVFYLLGVDQLRPDDNYIVSLKIAYEMNVLEACRI